MGSSGTAIGGGIGAAVGSIIPGIGTVLGGAIGSVVGFFTGLFGSGYDVTASQLPPAWQNNIALHKSFDTQKAHDDYVAAVWGNYAATVGLSASDLSYLSSQVSVGTWAGESESLVGQVGPRSSPPATPPRVVPGGSPFGNMQPRIPAFGPQPTPPNTHFPGGTPLHRRKRRATHHRRARHASSHL